jgi:crotonobetainyl-CoA:carnitine CoA-transferase CaiB-like acyl-CoA transferase
MSTAPTPKDPVSEDLASGDPVSEDRAPGPLAGLRVVELAGEWSPLGGKLLAEMGADVVLVEPPGGHHTRNREPYVDEPSQSPPARSA